VDTAIFHKVGAGSPYSWLEINLLETTNVAASPCFLNCLYALRAAITGTDLKSEITIKFFKE